MLTTIGVTGFHHKNGEVGLATATAGGDTVLCGARGTWTAKADLQADSARTCAEDHRLRSNRQDHSSN